MSTTTDFRPLTDLGRLAAESEQRIDAVGLTSSELDLFAAAWGRAIGTYKTASQRPVSAILILHAGLAGAVISDQEIKSRIGEVRANQALFNVLHVTTSGTLLDTEPIDRSKHAEYPAGRWNLLQASQLSMIVNNGAVVWVSGYEFKVFVGGHIARAFSDVSNMRAEHAQELSRRMPLNEEFFDQFAKQLLQHGSETGIWYSADYQVLLPNPESHIEERTIWFMKGHLTGYKDVARQRVDQSNGRIDLVVTFSDDVTKILELKWVGRALKKTYARRDPSTLKKQLKAKWVCAAATILEADSVMAGVVQLGIYLANPSYDGGFLAVFDCRKQRTDITVSATQLAAANIAPFQFTLADVKLDPRPPSKIGRAFLRSVAP